MRETDDQKRLDWIEEGIVMTPSSPAFLVYSTQWLLAEVRRLRAEVERLRAGQEVE